MIMDHYPVFIRVIMLREAKESDKPQSAFCECSFLRESYYILVPDTMVYGAVKNLYLNPRTTLLYQYYYQF